MQRPLESWEWFVLLTVILGAAVFGHSSTAMSQTREEHCLARNVYFEARGESYEGQLAVAHVTLNRHSAGFARSICGVVYQPGQFTWTAKSRRYPRVEDPLYQFALRAARTAVSDRQGDPTFGATHFDGSRRRPAWTRHATLIRTIGGHRFYWMNP